MRNGRKISFRLKDKGRRFYIHNSEISLLIILFLFSIVSVWLLRINFHKNIALGWFFPLLLIWQIGLIFLRPKWRSISGMTKELFDMISTGDEPFHYDTTGFTVNIKGFGSTKFNWTDITFVIAYRNEYFAHDEIGIEVLATDNISFAVRELTPGCLVFYEKLRQNLKLTDEEWFGNITEGDTRQIIFQKLN